MVDVIDSMNGYCIVRSQSNSSKMYEVYLCNGSYCNCQDQSSPLCKHIRAAARVLGGLEMWNLSLESERIETYNDSKFIYQDNTIHENNQNSYAEVEQGQRYSLNSNDNTNQFLCEELEDLKVIIQKIQGLPDTADGIKIKKQAEFQMKEFIDRNKQKIT